MKGNLFSLETLLNKKTRCYERQIKVLIACECSDEVRSRFDAYDCIDAWSCDLKDNERQRAKHLLCDVRQVLNDGWDAMIAFPPCTHLSASGAAFWREKRERGLQQEAIDFFLTLANAPIKHIAIENPVGIMSRAYCPPTQIIQPYFFGDRAQKTTCLWLKNLPKLVHNAHPNLFDEEITHVERGEMKMWVCKKTGRIKRQPMWYFNARNLSPEIRSAVRSRTFPGIAAAMAKQWGEYIIRNNKHV